MPVRLKYNHVYEIMKIILRTYYKYLKKLKILTDFKFRLKMRF